MVIMERKKSITIIFSILLVIIVLGLTTYNTHKNNTQASQNNLRAAKLSLTDEQKKNLKYNYEIPNTFNVLDIISENKLLIEEDNKLKIYNLDKEKFSEELIEITKNYFVVYAKVFDNGVIWIETNGKEQTTSKIFIKYFSDNRIKELDISESNILPSMSATSNYLTYYIVDDNNNINIKLFNLKEESSKVISIYELENSEGKLYVSIPNTNDNEIVWSTSIKDKSIIYSYNIEDDKINILSENNSIYKPVIKKNRLFAIEKYDYFDSEINSDYASDFIVEYNNETNVWDKFEKDRINNYILAPQECVINLLTNEGLLSWVSTFFVKDIYDTENKEFISLVEEDATVQANVQLVKNNVVYYTACDYEDKESKFIFILTK